MFDNLTIKIQEGSVKSPRWVLKICNSSEIYVVVQIFPWFKFYFPLFKTHYHTLPCPKTKENKI